MKYEMFRYGIVLRAEMGTNLSGKWQIGKINWTYVKSRPLTNKKFIVETISKIPDLGILKTKLPLNHLRNALFTLKDPNHQRDYPWNIICAKNKLKY